MAGYYELTQNDSGKYHFNLKAGNHETILSSQVYTTKSGAENGIESCRKNTQEVARYERKVAKDDSPYFVLKAGNGEIIGTSEMYSSASARDNGIESCKTNGKVLTKDKT